MSKRLLATFYRTAGGREPVREWLKALRKADRARIGADIKTVEFGWPIGMPTCRALGDGLYEVRSALDSRTARVLFCILDHRMILLHGFIKKSQNMPPADLRLARQRQAELNEK